MDSCDLRLLSHLNVTDFSYWSCHVHLSFLAWSQTS